MVDIIQALQTATEVALSEINTTMPGVLVSYNPQTNRAIVRPSLPKMLANGEPLPPPDVVEVPVAWTKGSGGDTGLTLPLKPGDGMTLHFAQRSLEGWLGGRNDAPDDPRRMDLSDAIAVPGLAARGISANPEDAEFHFGPVKLRLSPAGQAILQTAGGSLTIEPDGRAYFTGPAVHVSGNVVVEGDVTAGNISLRNHKHGGVQSGLSVSGVSVP